MVDAAGVILLLDLPSPSLLKLGALLLWVAKQTLTHTRWHEMIRTDVNCLWFKSFQVELQSPASLIKLNVLTPAESVG